MHDFYASGRTINYAICHRLCLLTPPPTDLTHLLPVLNDDHVKTGFTTRLLKEAISKHSSNTEHLEFILFDMGIKSSIKPFFDTTDLSAASVLRKEIFSLEIFKELIKCGMVITGQ